MGLWNVIYANNRVEQSEQKGDELKAHKYLGSHWGEISFDTVRPL